MKHRLSQHKAAGRRVIRRSRTVHLGLTIVVTLLAFWAELWALATAAYVEPESQLLQGHSGQVLALVFSPDGRLLASGGSDQTIRLWDLGAGRELKVLRGHSGSIHGLAFAADGRLLASASADSTIRIWDTAQGRELKALTGRFGAFRGVAFYG